MGISSHEKPNKGNTDIWLTPPWLIQSLGTFDLDPCAAIDSPYKTAKSAFTEQDDGLNKKWFGSVFMNPPYSKNLEFAKKFNTHRNGIALTFARTETKWFSTYYDADAFVFIKGRLSFYKISGERAKSNAGAPSVLIAYGQEFIEQFNESLEE